MFDYLLSEAQAALQAKARDFVAAVDPKFVRAMDSEDTPYPRHYLEDLAAAGLLGLRFDAHRGWRDEVCVLEEIGTLGTSLACLYSLPTIVGEALYRFGTEEQKARFLEPTIAGRLVCAEGLSEPRGGSDFFGASASARREGEHLVLSGQKRFIVGGEGADYFLVYARTDLSDTADPRHRITALLVERDESVSVEHVYGLMGTRGGGTARIRFNETRVPQANIILGSNRGAEVFDQMMVPERLTTAAGAIGAARAALEVATRYTTKRKAFGKKIMRFQAVSFHLAEAVAALDAARSLVWVTACAVDANNGLTSPGVRRMVSEAKKVATEAAWQVINHCMQVMGGIGYTDVFPIERLLRDARLMMIWTGTNEIMNLLIQHEWYRERQACPVLGRDVESDAIGAMYADEKDFGDESHP